MRACERRLLSQLGDEGVRIRRDDTCLILKGLASNYPGKREEESVLDKGIST